MCLHQYYNYETLRTRQLIQTFSKIWESFNKEQIKKSLNIIQNITSSSFMLVAVFQSLSFRIFVTLGKRIDIPDAVCLSDRVNSAPETKFSAKFFIS